MLLEQLIKYVLYGLAIAFLVRVAPLRATFAQLPRLQRRLLLGLFALILIAQVIETKYQSYPFVKWGMYDASNGRVTFYEYVGIRPDGSREPFPLARLLRIYEPLCPTCSKRLVWRLDDLAARRWNGATAAERADAAERYERLLRAAWAVYAANHPAIVYEEVRVWRGRCRAADYVDSSSIEREFAWSVRLGGRVPLAE